MWGCGDLGNRTKVGWEKREMVECKQTKEKNSKRLDSLRAALQIIILL